MFEAKLAFPGRSRRRSRTGGSASPRAIGNKDYAVVQGQGPRGFLATLYFDQDTGLLARMVRYGASPVGHVLTQTDYADYRDVNGIKFPFEYRFSWLDGRFSAKIRKSKSTRRFRTRGSANRNSARTKGQGLRAEG